jgi:hypothetical protein
MTARVLGYVFIIAALLNISCTVKHGFEAVRAELQAIRELLYYK